MGHLNSSLYYLENFHRIQLYFPIASSILIIFSLHSIAKVKLISIVAVLLVSGHVKCKQFIRFLVVVARFYYL